MLRHFGPLTDSFAHLNTWDGNKYGHLTFVSLSLWLSSISFKSHLTSSFVLLNSTRDLGLYVYSFRQPHEWLTHLKGNPPYTSGEILSDERYFDLDDNVFHDAVQDLESFFWVLVHMCLTRQGPGGVRPEELEQKNQEKEEYNGLRRVIHCFFDSTMNTMAANKLAIFKHSSEFDQYILDNFHGYFQPLRDLVKEWFHLLILAHKFHAFENTRTSTTRFLKFSTVHWGLPLLRILTKWRRRFLRTGKQMLRNCWMAIPSERFNSLHLCTHLRRVKDKLFNLFIAPRQVHPVLHPRREKRGMTESR